MTTSRRTFLKKGAFGALAAGVSLGIAEKNFGAVSSSPAEFRLPDMAAFKAHLGTDFFIGQAKLRVRLTDVLNLGAKRKMTGKREAFTLTFQGDPRPSLKQETYTIEHEKLGTFSLLLVPVGAKDNSAQYYEAVINRLHA